LLFNQVFVNEDLASRQAVV